MSAASLRVSDGSRRHYERALAAYRAHHDQECDGEIGKALESAPAFPEAHLLRAERAVIEHHEEAALADALEAQRLNAGLIWTPVVLAQAYNGLRRYGDALLMLQDLQGQVSGSWQAKYERARAEVGLSHAQAALYWSAQALAAVPKNYLEAHLLYADALQLSGRWHEASNEFELYIASSSSQPQRIKVLAALAFTERMARREEPMAMAER